AVEIRSVKLTVTARQRRKLVEATAADETGRLDLVWFNQAYLAETFRAGQHLMLYGLVKARSGRWTHLQMENPAFEILEGRAAAGPWRIAGSRSRIFFCWSWPWVRNASRSSGKRAAWPIT